MQFSALTLALQNFISVFAGGYSRLQGAVSTLLAILVGIDLVLMGLWWALGGGEQLAGVFKKVLYIGFWIWLVESFPSLAKAFVDSLVKAGITAGGGSVTVSQILDPSALAASGLDATEPLAQRLGQVGTFEVADMLVLGFGYVAIMACYIIMAVNLFLAVLEYYLFAGIVGILLPFGLLPSTKFLAEKAIGAVVAAGIKLMVLAFLTSAVLPVVVASRFSGPDFGFNELWAMLLTVAGVTVLSWKAPALASSLMAGSPSLGVGDVMQTAMTGAAAGGAVASFAVGNPGLGLSAATRAAAGAGAGRATMGGGGSLGFGASAGSGVSASTAGPAVAKAGSSLVQSLGGA
jgi:type IV secretion system protein TrbL